MKNDVKAILRENAWKIVMDAASSGEITPQKMDDLARNLGPPKIGGDHDRRGKKSDAPELRQILSDWYSETALNFDHEAAVTCLIGIFENEPVSIKPLAKKLRDLLSEGKINVKC